MLRSINKNSQLRSTILLLLASVIWGSAFVAQSVGMDYLGPFAFNGIRSLIGTAVLIPSFLLLDRWKERRGLPVQKPKTAQEKKHFIKASLCCGAALCAATMFQQIGLISTAVGKAGFLTAMYIVLVPVLGIFLHKKAGPKIWLCIAIAVLGLYFLCIKESFTIEPGDFMMLGSAFLFAIQILVINHFAPTVDPLRLSAAQFFVSGVISLSIMAFVEKPTFRGIWDARQALLYAGVMSSGIAYSLQIVAERDADPAIASLAMSMESVFSLLSGWLILGQMLTGRELLGCGLMFTAIILSQVHFPVKSTGEFAEDRIS